MLGGGIPEFNWAVVRNPAYGVLRYTYFQTTLNIVQHSSLIEKNQFAKYRKVTLIRREGWKICCRWCLHTDRQLFLFLSIALTFCSQGQMHMSQKKNQSHSDSLLGEDNELIITIILKIFNVFIFYDSLPNIEILPAHYYKRYEIHM